mmetsp:Transcript_52873/g.136542  ORF Transcript_52873/g.136542 Transcript_52873/m.136542 type:complete len:754 (-) Transcript_52873:263-2524(-)
MVKNTAFVFIKPHAVTDKTKELVKSKLEEKGITIKKEGSIEAEEIDKKMLIDKHYYAIAAKATLKKPTELPIPKDKFKDHFGVEWDDMVKEERVFNAKDACEHLGVDSKKLDALWATAKKEKKLVKFGGGFYCGQVDYEGKSIYAFNGFFMEMRSKFVDPGVSIYYYVAEWDSAACSWEDFRGQVLGPTDPADAPEGSLRGLIAKDWESLGLKAACNTGDNGVHASASPFEALAERMNWLGARMDSDPFGKVLIKAGVGKGLIKEWSLDPQVTFGALPIKKSIFDTLEDTDTDYCVALCQMIASFATEQPAKSKSSAMEKEVEKLKAEVAAYQELAKAVEAIQNYVPYAKQQKATPKAEAKAKAKATAEANGKDSGKAAAKGKAASKKEEPKKKKASSEMPAWSQKLEEHEEELRPGGAMAIKRWLKVKIWGSVQDDIKDAGSSMRVVMDSHPVALIVRVLASCVILWMLLSMSPRASTFVKHCHQVAQSLSNPKVVYKVNDRVHGTVKVDDYLKGYEWLDKNSPKDARVIAWWDYGYQITGIAKRTSLADGNTWNHEHIATIGRTLTSPEKKAWNVIRHVADYLLVWAGGGGDDLAKSPHLARIGNSVYPDHCGDDDPKCNKFSFYGDHSPTPMMAKSLLYKLVMHNMQPGVKVNENLFKEVHTTKHGLMRVFKVMNVSEESKAWVADPKNRICDAPGSWYCVGQYPPALEKLIQKRRNFAQIEDFNKAGAGKSAYTKMIEKELGRGGSGDL